MSELDGLKLLRRIEEGVAGKTGAAFFRQIIRDLALALNAHAAFTSRLLPGRRAAMLAFWVGDHFEDCLEYSLEGTPCEFVYRGEITAFARDIGETFPVDREWFEQLGVNSYLGIPVRGETGEVCGHLAVMDIHERDWREADVDVLRLFSVRTAAELERTRYEQALEEANRALILANEQLSAEVAERRRIEATLAAAKLAAEGANRAKSTFLAQMSHELRTPLNGLLGYAQLLQRDSQISHTQRASIEAMRGCGEHLLTLINELLDLAKVEAGHTELEPGVVATSELLEGVIDMISLRAIDAGLHLEVEISPQLPALIHADARRLRQVLLNLLGNAVKFTRQGRVALRVTAGSRSGDAVRLRFEIEDSGDGISEEELERVFEPFHQVHRRDRLLEGTGLGLPISRAIIEAMGGTLTVTSELGVGTTFAAEFEATVLSSHTTEDEASHTRVIGYTGPRRRVLIADDEPHNNRILRELLRPLGFDVHEAADGAEAIALAAELKPDIVLLDLIMPNLDGFAAARALRASESLGNVPLIALSASAFTDTRAECLAAGCVDFLSKPLQFDALLDVLKRRLGLEWLLEPAAMPDPQAAPAPAPDRSPVDIEIPAPLARSLLDHALSGDIAALAEDIDALEQLDAHLLPLARRLRRLAGDFDMKGIRSLLAPPSAPLSGTPRACSRGGAGVR